MAEPDTTIEERMLKRIPLEIMATALAMALPSLLIFDAVIALLVLAGGGLAAAGFFWLKQSLTRFLMGEKRQALRSALLLYGVRILLIIAVFLVIILLFAKKVIAFAAGFSSVILVFLAEAAVALSKMRQWKN